MGGRGVVDVRDASRVHFEALRKPEAANQRFIAYGGWINDKDVAAILDAEFGQHGFNVTTKVSAGTPQRDHRVSNKKSRETFGMEFISPKEAVIAMANSLIEHGVITKH